MQNLFSIALVTLLLCRPGISGSAGVVDDDSPGRPEIKGPLKGLLARPDLKRVKIRLPFSENGKRIYRQRELTAPEDIKAFRAVMEQAKLINDPAKFEADSESSLIMEFARQETIEFDLYAPTRYISIGTGVDRAYYQIKESDLRKLCKPSSLPQPTP